MTENKNPYYIVSDNDVYPPKLNPDWLQQMIALMDLHTDIAFLTPQLPPQSLQMPYQTESDVVYSKAVGNTFKIIRKSAYPIDAYEQAIGKYGDDGLVCEKVIEKGWKVAFCRNIFCYHAGQTTNWGYKTEEIALDPRKQGYGKPYEYEIVDWNTYEPAPAYKI
jgi:GT2 family glycosyltransferase